MADKILLSNEVRELKLGASFYSKRESPFHTVKYDFKPASVDTSKMASLEIGSSHEVSVTVPHLDGSGTQNTVFKGSKRPYTKECILVIDHKTGEITLERLGLNIQLKKTRAEGSSKINRPMPTMDSGAKKIHAKQQHTQKESQKARKPSPTRGSPTRKPASGPATTKTQIQSSSSSRANTNIRPLTTSSSMPALGLGDELDSPTLAEPVQNSAQSVGLLLTDSSSESGSSSSSDSSDSEDPDMEIVPTPAVPPPPVFHTSPVKHHTSINGSSMSKPQSNQNFAVPAASTSFSSSKPKAAPITNSLLNDDLCLSESGSDSD